MDSPARKVRAAGRQQSSGPTVRHYFDFPDEVLLDVEKHVEKAISPVDPMSFAQEPGYVAAVAGRLIGTAYQGRWGHVSFRATIVTDRGTGAAEKWSGTDLAITATISDGVTEIHKAILIQAKLGYIADLSLSQRTELIEDVHKTKRLTRAPKVMEIPQDGNQRMPRIISGEGLIKDRATQSVPLARYLSTRVLPTLHGDTRPRFITAVQDSKLTQLRMLARLER